MRDGIDLFNTICLALILIVLLIVVVFLDDISNKNTYHYDVNNDGKIDARDYVLIKNYIMSEDE